LKVCRSIIFTPNTNPACFQPILMFIDDSSIVEQGGGQTMSEEESEDDGGDLGFSPAYSLSLQLPVSHH